MLASAVCVAAVAAASGASALSIQWAASEGGNDHWYEYVLDWSTPTASARVLASASMFNGLSGYLVTITSAAENAFVKVLVDLACPLGGTTTLMIGGSDAASEGTRARLDGPDSGLGPEETHDNWAGGEPVAGTLANSALM